MFYKKYNLNIYISGKTSKQTKIYISLELNVRIEEYA